MAWTFTDIRHCWAWGVRLLASVDRVLATSQILRGLVTLSCFTGLGSGSMASLPLYLRVVRLVRRRVVAGKKIL